MQTLETKVANSKEPYQQTGQGLREGLWGDQCQELACNISISFRRANLCILKSEARRLRWLRPIRLPVSQLALLLKHPIQATSIADKPNDRPMRGAIRFEELQSQGHPSLQNLVTSTQHTCSQNYSESSLGKSATVLNEWTSLHQLVIRPCWGAAHACEAYRESSRLRLRDRPRNTDILHLPTKTCTTR